MTDEATESDVEGSTVFFSLLVNCFGVKPPGTRPTKPVDS